MWMLILMWRQTTAQRPVSAPSPLFLTQSAQLTFEVGWCGGLCAAADFRPPLTIGARLVKDDINGECASNLGPRLERALGVRSCGVVPRFLFVDPPLDTVR